MYIVDVLSKGTYGNVSMGGRVFLFRKSAKNFCKLLDEWECQYSTGKLVRYGFGRYCRQKELG